MKNKPVKNGNAFCLSAECCTGFFIRAGGGDTPTLGPSLLTLFFASFYFRSRKYLEDAFFLLSAPNHDILFSCWVLPVSMNYK